MSEGVAGRGSDRDYCSGGAAGNDGHAMSSISGGKIVKWIERCWICGWIDAAKLDEWAIAYLKEQLSARAQRVAVAIDTEPFAFVQPSSGDLELREILIQALAAAQKHGMALGPIDASTGRRESAILKATLAEVERMIRIGRSAE